MTTAASDPSPDAQIPAEPVLPAEALPPDKALPPDETLSSVNGGLGAAWILEFDLPALLAELGLASACAEDDDQEAVLAAEQEALAAHEATAVDITSRIAECLPPGPALACVLAQRVPGAASDWELPGIASSYRRLAAWAQAAELAAVAEIAARSAAANPKIGAADDGRPRWLPPEAAAQVALAMQMSQPGASDWVDLAIQMRWRLPSTGEALSTGTIDLARARIIAEGTAVLPDELATAVEERVLAGAADKTTGQLRGAVRRAVLAVDPEGAEERRKDTERRAKISLYPDEQGTATLTGSCLPGVHAAAAMARISAMARALKASGAQGGLDLLRAHIYLGLLLGTLPLIPPPADGPPDERAPDGPPDAPPAEPPTGRPPDTPRADGPPDSPSTAGPTADSGPRDPAAGSSPGDSAAGSSPGDPAGDSSPGDPPGAGCAGADCPGDDDCPPTAWHEIPPPGDGDAPPVADGERVDVAVELPSWEDSEQGDVAELPSPDWPTLPVRLPAHNASHRQAGPVRPPVGLVDVVVPWSALAGHSSEPSLLSRIDPVTHLQSLQLLVLAARSANTQWRVVVTDDDGRAIAVERARPGWHTRKRDTKASMAESPSDTTGVVGRVTVAIRASWLGTPRAAYADLPQPVSQIAAMIVRAANRAAARACAVNKASAEGGGCAHTAASLSYRPPPRIREFVAARDVTCRFGPCGQPAWRADLDHTVPWNEGGPTCSCNLGGCCRIHHKVKQLPRWRLEQPQPGVFVWTTPGGRSYRVRPDPYPV